MSSPRVLSEDDLLHAIVELGGHHRVVPSAELSALLRARGFDLGARADGVENGWRLRSIAELEFERYHPRFKRWWPERGRVIGFSAVPLQGPFEGWRCRAPSVHEGDGLPDESCISRTIDLSRSA
ncbi:MAG: hypothetical protein IPJ34_43200 [Myxococcales bacterium]|nr:hypothetical protein [Myxococcales bacterium]